MPNWVSNTVTIVAPFCDVQRYLAEDQDPAQHHVPVLRFHLFQLFPDRFHPEDPCGHHAWTYDWMCDHVGTKRNPRITTVTEKDGVTTLEFQSAGTPPNALLERLHMVTGWKITNAFEEEQPEYEGELHCDKAQCREEVRPGRPRCPECGQRAELDVMNDRFLCPDGCEEEDG